MALSLGTEPAETCEPGGGQGLRMSPAVAGGGLLLEQQAGRGQADRPQQSGPPGVTEPVEPDLLSHSGFRLHDGDLSRANQTMRRTGLVLHWTSGTRTRVRYERCRKGRSERLLCPVSHLLGSWCSFPGRSWCCKRLHLLDAFSS